jgi:cytochrome c biogenesis protein CcmG, thiol:disulfide interchange protein DsbE
VSKPERAATIVGGLVVSLALLSAGQDLGISLSNWDSYSPAGPRDPVPEFRAQVSDGTVLDPAALVDQVSLLTFWATWCHACGLEMPILAELEDAYVGSDLRIYGVNRDSGDPREREAAVAAYLAKRELEFPQIFDNGQLAAAFGVEAIPHMVLIDKRGQIRHVHMGRTSERTLRSEIDALLAE